MEAFLEALSQLGTSTYWIALFLAISVGTFVGFIPGVGATLVTAIMLPSVLFLVDDPAVGIVLLAMVASLNNTLDSIPAVLVGIPSGETQVTYLEGHQLARQGLGAYTLGAVYAVSAMGGVIGALCLALMIPVIKPVILQFSYTEIAMLALFGIAMVALLSKGSMAKGLAAGALGLLLGTVGVDPFSGADRYTFGMIQLWQGVPVITAILGFFALPELIDLTMTRQSVANKDAVVSRKEVFRGARHGFSRWRMVIRQSLFGTFMGAIPGIGGSVIDWLSYAFGISLTKDPKKHNFGKGSIEGVMFAESAANSKAGGQALPTLTLGIPGSTSWAIIAVAILSYGIAPGPSMLTQNQDITMLMVITLALGNLIVAGLGLYFTNYLARITRIPYPVVGFMIMGMVFLAAYMDLSGGWLVFPILLAFTALGLVMKIFNWPRPPLILGFILGPIVEQNMQSAVSIYGIVGVLTRPVAIGIFIALVVSVTVLLRLTSRDPLVDDVDEDGEVDGGTGPADPAQPGEHAPESSRVGDGANLATEAGEHTVSGPIEELGPDTSEPVPDASPVGTAMLERRGLAARLMTPQNLGPLFFILLGAGMAINALSFPSTAKHLPLASSLTVVALSLYQLVKQVVKDETSSTDIMDLGMQSSDMEGARSAGAIIAGLIALLFLSAGVIGLQYASVGLSVLGPIIFLEGRRRWISAAISGGVVWAFSEFLMEGMIGIIWPDPYILSWLGIGS